MIQAKRPHVKTLPFDRKWLKLAVLFLGLYLAWILVRGIWDIRKAYRRVDEAKARLAAELAKNKELKQKMTEVQTTEYIEKVARNELLMQKAGETVVVISREAGSDSAKPEASTEKELANYRKWWNLIK